jgi:hypothetical protein
MILLLCCIAVLLHLLALPWWLVLVAVFAAAFVKPAPAKHLFLRGFIAVFVPWLILCAWSGMQNNHILASRIASMFGLPHWLLLVVCSALLGGLISSLASLGGGYFRRWYHFVIYPNKPFSS